MYKRDTNKKMLSIYASANRRSGDLKQTQFEQTIKNEFIRFK